MFHAHAVVTSCVVKRQTHYPSTEVKIKKGWSIVELRIGMREHSSCKPRAVVQSWPHSTPIVVLFTGSSP